MLNKIPDDGRALILLEFVREILMHAGNADLLNLRNAVDEEEKELKKSWGVNHTIKKKLIEERIEEVFPKNNDKKITINSPLQKIISEPVVPIRIMPRVLRIPQPRLPIELNARPVPANIMIDLGKLNPLINDPVVREISCNGPGEKIVVMVPSPKETLIILDKDEISDIIRIFEEKSRIPATEGIYHVVVGKLSFSAIVSGVLGSKFVIKKLAYYPHYG